MPDPLSIVANAAAMMELAQFAYNFVEAIHTFCKTKPDKELDDLASEVDSFRQACILLHGNLHGPCDVSVPAKNESTTLTSVDPKLLQAFDGAIANCKKTVEQLSEIETKIRDRHTSWDRTVHFLRKRHSINDVRNRVQSHVLALQLISQSLNINVSYIAPQIANQRLLKELSNLRDLIKSQEVTLAALRTSHASDGEANDEDESNAQALIQCAQDVASSGRTLYDDSTSGSVMGKATSTRLGFTADWLTSQSKMRSLSDSTIETVALSTFSANDDSHTSVSDWSSTDYRRDSLEPRDQRPTFEHCQQEEDDDISDHAFELELLKNAREEGWQAFSQSNFYDAKDRLLESLEIIHELPEKRRPSIDEVWEMQYKLAVSSFHIDEPESVERALQNALQHAPCTDTQRRQLFHITHLRAQLYACTEKLELALQDSMNALRGRWNLLGWQNHETFCSLALTHRIHELQGQAHRAPGRLIREACRSKYLCAYGNLLVDDASTLRTTLDLLPEQTNFEEYRPIAERSQSEASVRTDIRPRCSFSRIHKFDDVALSRKILSVHDAPDSSPGLNSDLFTLGQPPTLPPVCIQRSTTVETSNSTGTTENLVHRTSFASATQDYDRERWLDTLRIFPTMPLQLPIARGSFKPALALIEGGSKDVRDAQGLTALHLASLFGDVSLVSSLISSGANVNASYMPLEANEYFFERARPIELAVAARKIDVVRKLLEHGAAYNDWSGRSNLPLWLMHAKWLEVTNCQQSCEIIEILKLLRTSANLKVNDDLSSGTFMLHRALRTAGYYTHAGIAFWVDVVEYLLNNGANRVSIGAFGLMPVHIACGFHHETDILRLLLTWGKEDVNLLSGDDYPLKLALQNKHADSAVRFEMARLLLKAGACVTPVDREGKSARSLLHTLRRDTEQDHQAALSTLLDLYANQS